MSIAKHYCRGWPFVLTCVLILTCSHDAPAQSAVVQVPVGTAPTIDGVIELQEWEDAVRLPLCGAPKPGDSYTVSGDR
jgi:hypothetical protein